MSEKWEHSALEYKKLLCNWSLISGHATVLKEIHVHLAWQKQLPCRVNMYFTLPTVQLGLLPSRWPGQEFPFSVSWTCWQLASKCLSSGKCKGAGITLGNIFNSNPFYRWHTVCSLRGLFQVAPWWAETKQVAVLSHLRAGWPFCAR